MTPAGTHGEISKKNRPAPNYGDDYEKSVLGRQSFRYVAMILLRPIGFLETRSAFSQKSDRILKASVNRRFGQEMLETLLLSRIADESDCTDEFLY